MQGKQRPIICGEGGKKRLKLQNVGGRSGGIVMTEWYVERQVEECQCKPSRLSIYCFGFFFS